MNTAQVEQRLEEIAAKSCDDEGAHSAEDRLYRDVLQSIAEGTASDPAQMARLALTSQEIDFERWCA